jgi:hypothetical protein
MNKEYIGDSVYVELNDVGQLVLYTDNGYGPRSVIYLEPDVMVALVNYCERYFWVPKPGAPNDESESPPQRERDS